MVLLRLVTNFFIGNGKKLPGALGLGSRGFGLSLSETADSGLVRHLCLQGKRLRCSLKVELCGSAAILRRR